MDVFLEPSVLSGGRRDTLQVVPQDVIQHEEAIATARAKEEGKNRVVAL